MRRRRFPGRLADERRRRRRLERHASRTARRRRGGRQRADRQGLDPTYGDGGFFTWAHPTSSTREGLAIVRQSDGKLVAAGGAYFRSDYVDVVRFTANGALDTTFGGAGTGHAIVGGLGGMFGMRLALAPDGKLLVLGITNAGYQVMVARLDTNGVIDPTWGTDGIIRFSAGSDQGASWGVAVQSDGKVVVSGGYGAA